MFVCVCVCFDQVVSPTLMLLLAPFCVTGTRERLAIEYYKVLFVDVRDTDLLLHPLP